MSLSNPEKGPVQTKKKNLWLQIGYLIIVVILMIGVLKIVYFFKEKQRIRKYIEESKKAQEMVSQNFQEMFKQTFQGKEGGKKDVPGEDVQEVPRYPGMIRAWYVGQAERKMVVYVVKASRDELLKFYEKEMLSNSWKKKKPSKKKQELTYNKGKRIVEILITDAFSKGQPAIVTVLSKEDDS